MDFQLKGVGKTKAPSVHGEHTVSEGRKTLTCLSGVKGSCWRTEKVKWLGR